MMGKHLTSIVTTLALAWSAAALGQEGPRFEARGPDHKDAGASAEAEGASRPSSDSGREPGASDLASSDSSREPRVPTSSAAARADRLQLDTTVVTGNRELPKVLYIVPWKKAGIGDLPAQPFNTLLDEMLTPVDRDVFRREVTYYDALSSGGNTADGASAAAGDAGGSSVRSRADGSEK